MSKEKMIYNVIEDLIPLLIPIDSVTRSKSNARVHDKRNLESIKASIKMFKQRTPIVVNKRNGTIEKGNGTHETIEAMGWTHIAAVFVDDDPQTESGYGIADNRTAELAEWDIEILSKQLDALEKGLGAEVAGFNKKEVKELKNASSVLSAIPSSDLGPGLEARKPIDKNSVVCPDCGRVFVPEE